MKMNKAHAFVLAGLLLVAGGCGNRQPPVGGGTLCREALEASERKLGMENVPNGEGALEGNPDLAHAQEEGRRKSACSSVCGERKIQVTDPTRVMRHDAGSLGIFSFCGESARDAACLDAAIGDGAQVLWRDSEKLTLFYPERFEAFIDAVRERVDEEAVEGVWSDGMMQAIPGVSGRRVDVEATRARLFEAILKEYDGFEVAVDPVEALSSDLEGVREFRPSVLIGEFRTQFSPSRNRTINVKLAASKLDGIFLMPGAQFSYNAWVGERSAENGFKEAPVIEQGQMVEGLGGGACQVSSTVHAAALLSGMDILERYNHTLPSSYIDKGMDAVVSYPALDLRIGNPHGRPVVLRVRTEGNILIAQFYSDKPLSSQYVFRHEVVQEIPFKEVITEDVSLEPETIKITKRGKPGYRVLRARLRYEDGREHYEKMLDDIYQAQVQRVSIAPGVIYPEPEALGEGEM